MLAALHCGSEARALVVSSTGKHFSAGMALDAIGGAITLDDASAAPRGAASGRPLRASWQTPISP